MFIHSRSWFGLVLCLAALLLSFAARADQAATASEPASAADSERYRRLIDDALAAYEEGRFVAALALFEQAYVLRPNARAMRGVALVLFELGDYVKTQHALAEALESRVDPLSPELRAQLLDLQKRTAQLVERVEVRLAPTGAALRVDGRDAELGPDGALWLSPGTHRVEASQPGFTVSVRLLDSVAGGSRRLVFTLLPVPRPREPASEPRRSPFGWGTAVAAGLTGAGLLAWRSVALTDALSDCAAGEKRGASCRNRNQIEVLRGVATGSAILALGLTITASVPFVRSFSPPRERKKQTLGSWSCALSRGQGSCSGVVRW